MKEDTTSTKQSNILTNQQTVTGKVRTYGTHVRYFKDGEPLGDNIYRFVIEIPYEEPEYVQGVLTCTIAEWSAPNLHAPIRVGCYMHKLSFDIRKAIVDVIVAAENADVIAINIEGRIVETRNLTL